MLPAASSTARTNASSARRIDVVADSAHEHYVDVKHLKSTYVMKPVLSSTGAVRLEDVRGEALMVQIAAKSMLLNTKTAQRIVDACVSEKQRDLMAASAAAPRRPSNLLPAASAATIAGVRRIRYV
jgi:hypothetical protein